MIDSPFEFGRIAAANALSDVYAMGGKPVTAMNIVCFPKDDMPVSVLKETLKGGLEKIYEAGAVLAGGHSVDDMEFKYGLSVTGLIHPDHVLTNCLSTVGHQLILTKPIGTGVIATAIKGKIASKAAIRSLIDVASTLNRQAAEVMQRFSPSACTDVTGFGLIGHLLEMARAGKKEIRLDVPSIPFIPEAKEYAIMGMIPAGAYENKKFCQTAISLDDSVDPVMADLIFDPQTSGGLIFSLSPEESVSCLDALKDAGVDAAIVAEVVGDHPKGHIDVV